MLQIDLDILLRLPLKIKSGGEKEKMSGWDVITEQEGFLLTVSPSSQNQPGRKRQTLPVFWNLYFKAVIKPLTWDA